MADLNSILAGAKNSINFSAIGTGVSFIFGILAIALVAGVVGYFVIQKVRYNKKITYFENVAGMGYIPTRRAAAMILKISDSGEEILVDKKTKQLLHGYGKKIDKNAYAFAKGSDGYWYNVSFGNLNTSLHELGIEPIDKDMRMMNAAIRKNNRDRFEKTSFLAKYGPQIAFAILVLVMCIGFWFVSDNLSKVATTLQNTMVTAKDVMTSSGQIISGLNKLQSGGAGYIQPAAA